ncbi:hypothetical protein TNCV_3586991 [Trichonephila clavipes]|nr:hypothetical protein TNCV_3586991 [Trichonephila clavipes]
MRLKAEAFWVSSKKQPVFSRGYDLPDFKRLPMHVNELLRHCCPFVFAAPIEAPESLLVVRYELPSVCLENPIHARWD